MSINKKKPIADPKNKGIFRVFTRIAPAIAIATTLFMALSVSGAIAVPVTDKPPPPAAPDGLDKFEFDPKVCNVTDAMVQSWIGNNSLTEALNTAYEDIVKGWSSLTDDKFGHKNSKNIDGENGVKANALKLMNEHRTALYKMSVTVTSNLNPACDTCRIMNTWGKLQHIKENTILSGKFSTMDPKKFGVKQLDDTTLAFYVDKFMAYEKLVRVLPNYPGNLGSTKRTEKNNECYSELDKFGTDAFDQNKCYKPYVKKDWLDNFYGNKILNHLKDNKPKKSDPKMVGLGNVTCLPLSNYRFIGFAPIP